MRVGFFLALLIAVSLCSAVPAGAAASPTRDTARITAIASDVYRISAGDTLYVLVPGEEIFTRECQVSGAGTISYPQLGDVPAAGATCSELGARLEKQLRTYLKHPRVTVTVRQYGTAGMSVFVMGEVKSPGAYPLANGSGFFQAIATAGGLTEMASGTVNLLRPRTGESRMISLSDLSGTSATKPELLLQPGDVLLVQRKDEARYAVLGEVPDPGMFDMPLSGQVRVLDALQKAGVLATARDSSGGPPGSQQTALDDPNRLADLEHATLTRAGAVTVVNVVALLAGDTSHNLVIQPGDVLTVPRRASIKAYALGEVRASGRQMLPVNATVLDLLNAAGGTTTSARPDRASVLRMVGGQPTSVPVDLGKLYARADMKQNLALRDGDVLYVPPRKDPREVDMLRLLPYLLATL